ncbi:MAG: glycosyltransferase family 4 protein [Bacteroidota bacterium]
MINGIVTKIIQMTGEKKIGFLCSSSSLGGLEINVVRLAFWMKQRGWEVVLYVLKNSPIEAMAKDRSIRIRNIVKHWKYFDIIRALKLLQKLRADNVNLLLVRDNRDISLAAIAKTFSFNKLRIIYQQAMQIGINKKDIFHTIRYSKIDAWLTPLKWLAGQVKARTNFPANKIHIVPLGIELEKFINNKYTKEKAREFFSLSSESRIIGIIGRLAYGKGQHLLIEAIHHLNTQNYNVELLIVGEPTKNEGTQYLDHLNQLVTKYNLNDKVHFRPFTDKVEIFYRAIDIFTLASKSETFGTVTIEAMASGLPIIGTNTGGTPEILKYGGLGLLFTPGNMKELVNNITALLDDPSKMKALGESARKEAIEKYSHIAECRQIEEIINADLI